MKITHQRQSMPVFRSLMRQMPAWKVPASSSGQTVQVLLQYEDGSYYLTEEYEDYDLSSFIADVGGYLGLLLGHSVLSYYYIFVDLMMKVKDVKIKRYVLLSQNISKRKFISPSLDQMVQQIVWVQESQSWQC